MSLEQLLDWAKSVGAFIEIFTTGAAQVQMGVDFEYRVEGDTLRDALTTAKQYYGQWDHEIFQQAVS